MCGIGAVLGPDIGDRAEWLVGRLAHRGPDGSGILRLNGCTLLMTRLAIMDPTVRSDQPMSWGDHHLVFNGEVVNHRALRVELEGRGHRFVSEGDTEVVLHALVEWGPDAAPRFRGMFAFAWWDAVARRLTVGRDALGVKPLYWRPLSDGRVALASEAAPLAALGGADVDHGALREFLRFGSTVSGPAWNGVHELDPGTVAAWSADGSVRIEPWHPLVGAGTLPDAVRASVAENLVADRPVSLFLSGGFDSALLAALVPPEGSGCTAFTLATGRNDEDVVRASATATRYGLPHHVVGVAEADVQVAVVEHLAAMDQPTIDGFNTFLISRAVEAAGFPVALSGLGGDEAFGGYGYHRWHQRVGQAHHVWRRLPGALRRPVLAGAGRVTGRPAWRIGEILDARDLVDRHVAWRTLFTDAEVAALTGAPAPASIRWDLHRFATAEDAQLRALDLDTYLRPTLLRDADVFSMANGVEVRVPLLDDRVLAAAGSASKADIARALGDPHLADVASRRKLTFSLPWGTWLPATLAANEPVFTGADPWFGVVDPEAARRVLARQDGSALDALRAWALLVLARWLERGTPT